MTYDELVIGSGKEWAENKTRCQKLFKSAILDVGEDCKFLEERINAVREKYFEINSVHHYMDQINKLKQTLEEKNKMYFSYIDEYDRLFDTKD